MKEINGFYVDENNNSWDSSIFTEERAIKFSKTLINCSGCSDCSYCSDCRGCSYCSDCRGCSYCSDCRDCSGCRNFKSNPAKYISLPIGSRKDQTATYWLNDKSIVICGCFSGTLEEFEKIVLKTHSNTEFGKQYQKYIKQVKMLMDND